MKIVMWRTTKRDNSTATPDSKPAWFTNRIEKEVSLKEDTDILRPVFRLKMSGHDGQNYLQAFGRYYWINNIRSLANNYWELDCNIDVLGSYRGHIRNTTAYVLYDSTTNTEIPDKRLGVYTTPTVQQNTVEMPWNFASGKGTKFIAIECDGDLVLDKKAQSATGVYSCDDSTIQAIGMKLDFDDIFQAFTDVADTAVCPIQKQGRTGDTLNDMLDQMDQASGWDKVPWGFLVVLNYIPISLLGFVNAIKGLIVGGDALKHIKSAYWLPFDCYDEGISYNRIAVGSFVDDLPNAKLIINPYKTTVVTINIPWQYNDWRNVQNTEIQLFIPLIGNINIPASAVKGTSTLTIRMNINMYSGAFSVRVQASNGATLGSYGASVQMPILIGDSNVNAPSVANTIVSTAGTIAGLATGNVALTAGAVTGMISSGLDSLQPISTSVGGIGGGAGNQLGIVIACTTICHNTSDTPSDLLPIIGTPTNVLKQLSGTGFCQTMQAHMNASAVQGESYPTSSEIDMVNKELDSGVFLE
jgi:hypothetical protein